MSQPRRHGFTLIEVLVALAVVSIALIAALRASGSVQDNALRFQQSVLADQCGENYLVELRLRRQFLGIGTTTARCTEAEQDFVVQAEVSPTPNPNFRRVNVSVLDLDGHAAWSVTTIIGNL
jgi:general secretion pathway protein I